MSLRSQGDGSGRWSFCSRRGSSAARLSDLKPGTIPRVKIGEERSRSFQSKPERSSPDLLNGSKEKKLPRPGDPKATVDRVGSQESKEDDVNRSQPSPFPLASFRTHETQCPNPCGVFPGHYVWIIAGKEPCEIMRDATGPERGRPAGSGRAGRARTVLHAAGRGRSRRVHRYLQRDLREVRNSREL
jgi:hypothetical protein